MIFQAVLNDLNPKVFDIIIDEFLFKNPMLSDRSNPVKIELHFMNILENEAVEAYPKFEHRLNNFNNSLLCKAETAGYLYLHYKSFDIEDDYIDYVILAITIE